jgi:predicted flap endonuclease-1-like 5' DNA nuclease
MGVKVNPIPPTSHLVRLVALWLAAVALSVGWLLLRRRTRRGPRLQLVPDLPAEPRRPEPVASLGRPVHDTGEGAIAPAAVVEQEHEDDLRRIRGVGPAIESTLHGLGIRSYRQLVTLDAAGLDRVRDALRDPQRIERGDWLGQARRLHREKYGEEV